MFRHYLQTAIRILTRNKGYAAINIVGLAAGFLTCLVIAYWVRGELGYDRFHANADSVYRVTYSVTIGDRFRESATCMAPLTPAAVERYPEFAAGTRLRAGGSVWVSHESIDIKVPQLLYADTAFFSMFSFPLLSGSPSNVLRTAYSAVLSENTASRLFGDADPVGQAVQLGDGTRCTVTGIARNCPANSHIQFDIVVSLATLGAENPDLFSQWGRFGYHTYLLAPFAGSTASMEEKLNALAAENLGPVLESRGIKLDLRVQRLTDIHLHSALESELSENGSLASVYLFSGIALAVLLMAGLNFINLATARSEERMAEVGLRKALGASKRDLVAQSMVEGLIIVCGAVVLAIAFLYVFMPAYGDVLGMTRAMPGLEDVQWLALAGASVLTFGALIGLGPAVHLATVTDSRHQNPRARGGRRGTYFRRLIVVIQFTTVTALIIGTIAIGRQIDFLQQKDLGIGRDGLVFLPDLSGVSDHAVGTLRDELLRVSGVGEVSLTTSIPMEGPFPLTTFRLEGQSDADNQLLVGVAGDANYVRALGIEIVRGRGFSRDLITDSTDAVLINETAAALFGEDPVGKTLVNTVQTPEGVVTLQHRIIGVVRDFHFKSLHARIEPLVVAREPLIRLHPFNQMVIRIESDDAGSVLADIGSVWQRFAGDRPFDYVTLTDLFTSQYAPERRIQRLVVGFGVLAIVVGCLGLLGMMSHVTLRRMKEVAIRKTVGAGTTGIVTLLMKDMAVWVCVSALLAVPIAYWCLQRWLATFAYSAPAGASIYLLAGGISLCVAALTTGFHAIRAARRPPVETLRYE